MMTLKPDYYLYATDDNLERIQRKLINSEPERDHMILDCWDQTCQSCQRWREWAQKVKDVNHAITSRRTINKKA